MESLISVILVMFLYIPKDNHIAYECDEKCVIFYAAYPHDWKQKAGITFVPGIDPEDMPQ